MPEEHKGLVRNQESAPTVLSSAEEFWSSKPAVGSSNLSGPASKLYPSSSVVEHNLDKVGVGGSFPPSGTMVE